MSWKPGPPRSQGPRDTSSNQARFASRAQAEAEGLAIIERETKVRREKTARLRKLREAREAEDAKAGETRAK